MRASKGNVPTGMTQQWSGAECITQEQGGGRRQANNDKRVKEGGGIMFSAVRMVEHVIRKEKGSFGSGLYVNVRHHDGGYESRDSEEMIKEAEKEGDNTHRTDYSLHLVHQISHLGTCSPPGVYAVLLGIQLDSQRSNIRNYE